MKRLHPLTAGALVTAVTLTACGSVAAPDGPPGTVTEHHRVKIGSAWRYKLTVQPDTGGGPASIRVWRSERDACAIGDHYPDCLNGKTS